MEPKVVGSPMKPMKAPPEPLAFHLRPATLSDAPAMASIASTAYLNSALTRFLSPHVYTYVNDYIYSFERRIRTRMTSPRNISVVAIEDDTEIIIGYAQFLRLGYDSAALALLEGQDTWHLRFIRQPLVWAREWWDSRMFIDRSQDLEAVEWFNSDQGTYWLEGKFENRYHAQTVVVSLGHQRRGVGRKLMEVVLDRARDEGVAVGLEASPEGERLYKALGFRLKEEFRNKIEGEEEGGGVFVWEPPGWERE
ncbi:acyl-CoA N-acyltransferase [Wilcoxina mikolae CBS 423.85]|nr:acyl-CoA N-acyltransferase [Wilcoxina mikolae CBS 423.85]